MKNINTAPKANKTPVLTCIVTGKTRNTNQEYLANKASKAGTTVEEIVSHYVSREVLKNLRRGDKQGLTDQQVSRILALNGKQKGIKASGSRRVKNSEAVVAA
jgi:predicted DNA-binding protein